MNSNLYKGFIYSIIMVLTVITFSCNKDNSDTENKEKKDHKKITRVKIKKITSSVFVKRINLTGMLKAGSEVTVSAEENGVVKEIYFEKGSKVKKRDPLVRLDNAALLASLSEVKYAYDLEYMNYERLKSLKDKAGAVSDFDLKSAELKKNMAAARVNIIKTRLDKTLIKAPMDGVIDKKFIETGELLSHGSKVAKLIKTSVLKAEASIAEKEIGFVRKGAEAVITIDAYPEITFIGKVDYISPAADDKSSSFLIEIPFDNGSEKVRPGLMVRISLIKERCEKCIVIPQDSIINETSGEFVFLLGKDNRVIKRDIYPGYTERESVVINKGLSIGDLLITKGQRNIVEGELVVVSD